MAAAAFLSRSRKQWTSAACSPLLRSLSTAVTQAAAKTSSDASNAAVLPQIPPFNYTPRPYEGPLADEILAKRKKFLNPALFLYYKKHVSDLTNHFRGSKVDTVFLSALFDSSSVSY